MVIAAHQPANPLKQRIKTPSLVIVELVLSSLPQVGTAGQLLYLSLAQNYVVAPSRLYLQSIVFDYQQKYLLGHIIRMSNIVKQLQMMCVVSIQLSRPLD